MNNIADDINRAYNEGYEQGCFDGVMDATDGKAACKGYDVVAVVRCKNCFFYGKEKEIAEANYLNPDMYCCLLKCEFTEDGFCSYGRPREDLYKTE